MTHRFLSNSVLCTVQPDRTAITFFKLSDANPLGRELSLLLSMETSAPPISALIMTFSLPSQTLALVLAVAIAVFECTLRLGSARPAFISFQALWRVCFRRRTQVNPRKWTLGRRRNVVPRICRCQRHMEEGVSGKRDAVEGSALMVRSLSAMT